MADRGIVGCTVATTTTTPPAAAATATTTATATATAAAATATATLILIPWVIAFQLLLQSFVFINYTLYYRLVLQHNYIISPVI